MKIKTSVAIEEEYLKKLDLFPRGEIRSVSALLNELLRCWLEEKMNGKEKDI